MTNARHAAIQELRSWNEAAAGEVASELHSGRSVAPILDEVNESIANGEAGEWEAIGEILGDLDYAEMQARETSVTINDRLEGVFSIMTGWSPGARRNAEFACTMAPGVGSRWLRTLAEVDIVTQRVYRQVANHLDALDARAEADATS